MITFAEYCWVDGSQPTQKLRSKTKVVEVFPGQMGPENLKPEDFPEWSFDGSSTGQATGNNSECILKPVTVRLDPLREAGPTSVLILCEVMNPDGTPHESNQRAKLRKTLDNGGNDLDVWIGFEQEFVLLDNKTDTICGWPKSIKHYPKPQKYNYCGIGADEVVARDLLHEVEYCCLRAGLLIFGSNFEVMLGQAEVQLGYRGFIKDVKACPLRTSDDLLIFRYILYRVGEKYDIYATLDPKPKEGDWNGSGCHVNFSDKYLRDTKTYSDRVKLIQKVFEKNHMEHQKVYGYGNERRLTGKHETAPYDKFSMGVADRGASIRIPNKTNTNNYGHLEDRRPSSNVCPYIVANRIIKSLLEIDGKT